GAWPTASSTTATGPCSSSQRPGDPEAGAARDVDTPVADGERIAHAVEEAQRGQPACGDGRPEGRCGVEARRDADRPVVGGGDIDLGAGGAGAFGGRPHASDATATGDLEADEIARTGGDRARLARRLVHGDGHLAAEPLAYCGERRHPVDGLLAELDSGGRQRA